MILSPGTRLGPYEILAAIGAGGMGEVYRASDPRLGRNVAIKVLPAGFSSDPERLHRFSLEARAASALNHPNILTIFDIGSYQDSPYLVSELLEGQTLREALRSQRQLSPRKAIDFALQIANGLSSAHHKGIVHRDLKPENLFLGKDGRVKILDFGLAKLTEPNSGSGSAVTLSAATDAGTVLGTVGYMAPEQVRGLPADPRSDIFSFGAILYEMLAGQSGFPGGSSADISSAILKDDPSDLPALNPQVSPALDRVVRHCLEKDPAERFQSVKDLAFALQSVSTISETSSSAKLHELERKSRAKLFSRVLMWSALAILLAAAAMWVARSSASKSAVHNVVRSERLTDFVGLEEFPAISPDGKSVAFVSDAGGHRQLWVRLLRGGVPLQITHDAVEHLYPRWSRDSASIIYYSPPPAGQPQGMLWEVSALGGFPRQLTGSISGADVSHDGKLAFFKLENGMVQLVNAERDGSNPLTVLQSISNSEQPSFNFAYPRWSPDDKWIAYQHATAMWSDDLYVVAASGGNPRQLTRDGQLMEGLAWTADGSGIVYSSARGSTVLYLPSMQLWLVKLRGGDSQQLTYGDMVYEHPDVSGPRIIASRRRMQFDIWKYPVGQDAAQNVRQGLRLTQQSGAVYTPTISPDDSELAFLSDSGGHGNIWVKNLQNGDMRQITYEQDPRNTVGTPVWSPHGKQIAFFTTHKLANWGTGGYSVVDSDGSNSHSVVQVGSWAAWSGDGKFLYYTESLPTQASKSKRLMKILVDGGEPITVRNDGATSPAPAWDSSALFYIMPLQNLTGGLDFEVRAATPESGPSRPLTRISASRVPQWQGLHPTLSHDGKWLALPLNDSYGTNIWLISTSDGKLRQLTDFGQQRTFIVRRVSWSSDDRYIFAAVAEGQADVVLLDGLLN